MRTIKTKIVRQCQISSDIKGNPLVITLLPNEMVDIRSKGTRTHIQCSIQDVYNLAVIKSSIQEQKIKAKEYKIKHEAGIKCRKPGTVGRVFSKEYYAALGL